ncbi:MAG: adenylate/guanylate cyclase domain-containing protein [Treponema sp.]|nr:adenylate/guanylate cyclase domain-containing protein [Treponema sp.]
MSATRNRRALDRIPFSIGAKLITIISFIVVISLGSITALVSWLVQSDLRISAEENNFEMNRRTAMEAESTLINVRSNTRTLIQTITSLGQQNAIVRSSTDFFFTENPQIAAVFFITPGRPEQLLVNETFFSSREINQDLAAPYFQNQRTALGRAVRGETVLQNATPYFTRSSMALFFPWDDNGVGGVLFSSEDLNNNFGFGINQSYMLNSDGDILVHSNFEFIKENTNIADLDFARAILESPERSRQQLLFTNFGAAPAPPNPLNIGFLTSFWEKAVPQTQVYANEVSEFLINYGLGSEFFSMVSIIRNLIGVEPDKKPPARIIEEKTIRQFVAYTKLNSAGAVVITSIEFDKVFEGIAATTRRNIYLTVVVLCISIIFVWFFSKTISVPLKALTVAAREIEGGNFTLDLQTKRRDEIGVLNSSFGKMCSALHIFGRFTNRDIAVKAMRGEIKPGGLPKHGTVFFSDIREFTAKSEGFTKFFGAEASDKIVFWLNEYFTQMVDCVEKTNGVVDKFIGDAVMAHWGTAYSAGSPRKDAFNAVKASLMMRKALFFLNKARKTGDPASPPIRIGCGLNSGIVTAGQLGSDQRMEYTVIGDPVNLASRIEALTKPLGADILISEDTWNLIGDKFITEEMPSVSVKGKSKPVRIFAVVNFSGEIKGPQSLDDVRSLLGIEPPVLDDVDVNADEKKYKIGEGQEKK